MDIPPPLLSPHQSTDPSARKRTWVDHAILLLVILVAFAALRYMLDFSGSAQWR